ncbi:uncharacterized protein LOC135184708 [Pogoniulus pusillus]|uniref:uncharacterized protein LOC135184708 n=1 Tax=Pogoniulus pusillus TaxID=488313 RepID=UPI0030B9645A
MHEFTSPWLETGRGCGAVVPPQRLCSAAGPSPTSAHAPETDKGADRGRRASAVFRAPALDQRWRWARIRRGERVDVWVSCASFLPLSVSSRDQLSQFLLGTAFEKHACARGETGGRCAARRSRLGGARTRGLNRTLAGSSSTRSEVCERPLELYLPSPMKKNLREDRRTLARTERESGKAEARLPAPKRADAEQGHTSRCWALLHSPHPRRGGASWGGGGSGPGGAGKLPGRQPICAARLGSAGTCLPAGEGRHRRKRRNNHWHWCFRHA